jgi:NADH:ubiquinone oxidoreductase subunit E
MATRNGKGRGAASGRSSRSATKSGVARSGAAKSDRGPARSRRTAPHGRGSQMYEVLKGVDFEQRQLIDKQRGVGLFDLVNDHNGALRCYSCTLCERTCPVDCIDIEYTSEAPEMPWDVAAERAEAQAAQPEIDPRPLDAVIAGLRAGDGLVEALIATQAAYRYLPRRALEDIATELDARLSHIYGVATFFPQFSLQPVGKYLVEVCVGAACHVAGAPLVLEAFSQEIEVAVGQTTDDMLFTLKPVNCVGACALAPVVRLNDGEAFGGYTPAKARKLVRSLRRSEEA